MKARIRKWIRELVKWAAPELFHRPIRYVLIQKQKQIRKGEFHSIKSADDAPWQLTIPSTRYYDPYGDRVYALPLIFDTFDRERGSLDPIIYVEREYQR